MSVNEFIGLQDLFGVDSKLVQPNADTGPNAVQNEAKLKGYQRTNLILSPRAEPGRTLTQKKKKRSYSGQRADSMA